MNIVFLGINDETMGELIRGLCILIILIICAGFLLCYIFYYLVALIFSLANKLRKK